MLKLKAITLKKDLVLGLSLVCLSALDAQYVSDKFYPTNNTPPVTDFNDWSYKLSTTINQRDVREHIFTLADDSFEGRETGTEANMRAAAYIANKFERLGLPKIGENNSYYQSIAFTFSSWKNTNIMSGDKEYRLLWDFLAFPQHSVPMLEQSFDGFVFAGYGIEEGDFSDYADGTFAGKAIMVYDGEPMKEDMSIITGTETKSEWSEDWQRKSILAKQKGASLLIIISNDLKELIGANRRIMLNRVTEIGDHTNDVPDGVNTVFISTTMAQELLGEQLPEVIKRREALVNEGVRMAPLSVDKSFTVNLNVQKEVLRGYNVMGFIEGTTQKDEVVIVSAHYDHIGKKGTEVYNGADDNASGTTAVLEIAEALATGARMGKKPLRSVLCLLVTGEEKGLLGSAYYADHPVFPIANTVANVNIDMVGRIGEEYLKSVEEYVYVIGSDRLSSDLHRISEEMNQKYGRLVYDYKYNDANDPNQFYFRSDHYNFAKHGIPSIFFFNGVHEDYHQLGDTPDKIHIPMLTKRAQNIFHLIWELANRKDRIKVDRN